MNKKNSLFFDTSLIYFVVIMLFVGLRVFSNLVPVNAGGSVLLNFLIQIGFMFLVPLYLYKFLRKKKTKEVFKDFNVKKINFKAVLLTIIIGFIVYFLNLAIASFFNIFIYGTGYDPSFGMSSASTSYPTVNFIRDIIITAILPGICEEFCHRGLLVNGYKQLDMKKTIILVGFLFGLMHLNIEQFFYASVIGMFLTFLVYVTGSIIPSMIVHFMNNFMGLYLTFASFHNLPLGKFSEKLGNALINSDAVLAFVAIIFVVILFLAFLAYLVFLLMKQTRVKQFTKLAEKAIEKKQREELFNEFNLNANEIDKAEGKTDDDKMPEVIFQNRPNGLRGVIVDINFSKNMLEGDYIIKRPSLKDKIFLYGTIFLGVVITISTLIWGIL